MGLSLVGSRRVTVHTLFLPLDRPNASTRGVSAYVLDHFADEADGDTRLAPGDAFVPARALRLTVGSTSRPEGLTA